MPITLGCAALQIAIVQRNPAFGLLVHRNMGAQNGSTRYQAQLFRHGLVGSMSRKGNYWLNCKTNAVMERLFLNLNLNLNLKQEQVWQKD